MYRIPKTILLFVFLMSILTACQSEKEPEKILFFSTENLPKTTFQFLSNRDTFLIGKEGTVFHVPANAFLDKNGDVYNGQVEIELLEAFTLEDMILGNLTTVSDDGRLLESNGMFRFSMKGNGKVLKVNPAAKVMLTIPAVNLEDDSQFFYGNVDEQGGLIWSLANLTNIESSNKRLLLGHNLFLKECASCHNINLTDDMTGPALAWVEKRWKRRADLIAFTRNSEGFAESGNLRARLMIPWAPSAMIAFENMSDEEMNAIYYYIDETARARKIDSTGQDTLSDAYLKKIFDAQDSIRAVNDSIGRMNNQPVFNDRSNLLYQVSNELDKPFNWVNIDRYVSTDAPKQKDLKVLVNKDLDFHSVAVKIIISNQNTIVRAYQDQEKNYYSFTERYQLKSTPFSIGEKAYLLATGMRAGGIYYALKSITIGDNELEKLNLKLISEEALKAKIKETF
ncbi:MAG: cytochrome c2 [Aureispira sp.]|jgi:cytochrome c2